MFGKTTFVVKGIFNHCHSRFSQSELGVFGQIMYGFSCIDMNEVLLIRFARNFRSRTIPCLYLTALYASVCISSLALAQNPSHETCKTKAEYLYNFAKLVDWPTNSFADAKTPITIGVIGSNTIEPMLAKTVKGKLVGGRKVVARHFTDSTEVNGCQILFIDSSVGESEPSILEVVAGKSILTVGESDKFLHEGGMIRFIHDKDAVRFEILLYAAEKAGLKISSKLLQLARPVYRAPTTTEGR